MQKNKKLFNVIEISKNRENPNFILISALLNTKQLNFSGLNAIENFLDFITKSKKLVINFYAADATFLFPEFAKYSFTSNGLTWKLEFFAVKSSIYNFSFSKVNHHIKFISINKFITYENEIEHTLGKYQNLPYWETDESIRFPQRYTLPENKLNWEEVDRERKEFIENWNADLIKPITIDLKFSIKTPESVLNILQNNLYYLRKIIELFDNEVNIILPNWMYHTSISSIALEIFKKNFNVHNIKFNSKIEDDNALRPAFFGGRCEVFGNPYSSLENIYYFDFPNMYAEIMKENFPIGELEKLDQVLNISRDGFYYCIVESDSEIPILPHRTTNLPSEDEVMHSEIMQEELVFTNGRFEGLYSQEELKFFEENGGKIISIKYAYLFKTIVSTPIFKLFVSELIEFREFGNRKLWKSLLVAFFGRIGIKPIETSILLANSENYKEITSNLNVIRETWINKFCLLEHKIPQQEPKALVWYTAIIAARARIKLYKNFTAIKLAGGRLLYCDTDSIYAAFPKKQLIFGKKHGDIFWDPNNPKTRIDDAVFASVRTYSCRREKEWETIITSIPRNKISFDEFKKNFYETDAIFYPVTVNRWDIFKHRDWQFEKYIRFNSYKKRKFNEDKKQTKPFKKYGDYYEKDSKY